MSSQSDSLWSDSSANDLLRKERFSSSQAVREWLVYQALASGNKPLPPSLRVMGPGAFERVCMLLRKGLLELDYKPDHLQIVHVPPINDPLYMQAMLYWSVRLKCTLPLLAEGYAQLGKYASFDQVQLKVRELQEEEKASKRWMRTDGHTHGAAATLPMPSRL
ncbi:MAG: hypothetical protein Q7T87_16140 [Polaromonas sp.]|nr:hypothetical protein [Polaromonas sp.]